MQVSLSAPSLDPVQGYVEENAPQASGGRNGKWVAAASLSWYVAETINIALCEAGHAHGRGHGRNPRGGVLCFTVRLDA